MSRVVLITGAAGGLGGKIALAFARKGYIVAGTDQEKKAGELAALAESLQAAGAGGTLMKTGDITASAFVDELVAAAAAQFGTIHVLVNNAGINHDGYLLKVTPAQIEEQLRVNLLAPILMMRAAGLLWKSQRPLTEDRAIVNISSVNGTGRDQEGQVLYCVTKGGLVVATVLTLLALPAMYAAFFRVRRPAPAA